MFQTGELPQQVVKDKGLEIKTDTHELEVLCQEIIEAFPKAAAEFRAGKEKALNVLKGQMMKRTQGKAPIDLIETIFKKLLS